MFKRFWIFSVIALAVLMATGVYAGMFGFTKKTTVHLSPPVEGVVTLNGQPLVGIEVYRTLDYDQEYKDKALTDAGGRFAFPEKNLESRRPNQLGDETRVRQVIGLDYEGKNYLLWYAVPGGITPREALSQRLAGMKCELTTPEKEQVFENVERPEFPHSVFSICRW
ncbi:DUF4198 domain-containing protein [Marinobacter sp. S6332]|uniref:DUF4198 domain-containing protein n=1 Tax=Marinobacter sp. S6332 TaxID=2926403 RepID=UPI001FF5E4DF|nr:DUF4198 domain-containing protein [Marinobacter sp. S6332]MCK0163567.1 DUF4198 domain-containing protein [Marinobacter sp. S6332]